MGEWKEGIWLAVSAFITATLLTFVVVMESMVKDVSRAQQRDSDSVVYLEEYRKISKYDKADANQADVVSCIMEYRLGTPAVTVTTGVVSDTPNAVYTPANVAGASNYKWDATNPAGDYLAENINGKVPPEARFRSFVVKDGNGAIVYIWFRRIS